MGPRPDRGHGAVRRGEAEFPHRLTGVRRIPLGSRITDPRVAAPARGVARVFPAWAVAKAWANLERDEILDTGHRFPAFGIAVLVTVTAVLRLVADGRFALDSPALAREALTPQAAAEHGAPRAGLGWIMRPRGDTAFVSGTGFDGVASLTVRIQDNRTHLVMSNG